MHQLRIGLVGPLPPPNGGMANQTKQLANLLRAENIQVSLVQVNPPYKPAWISKIKVVRAVFRLIQYLLQLKTTAKEVDLFHIMANSGWSWYLFAAPAIWIAKHYKIAAVINYRGGGAQKFFSKSFKTVNASLSRADAIIVPSKYLAMVFSEFGLKVRIVPNIINGERFACTQAVQRDCSDSLKLLVARNLETVYGIETAIKAFKIVQDRLPNAQLIIAGSGPEKQNLRNLSKTLCVESKIDFVGRVDTSQMPELYQQAHIALNSSIVDNTPNSILEALASGVPVVSTNVGGVPYLVEHEKTALLVEPNDPESMAKAVLRLVDDYTLYSSLRDEGKKYVEQFTWENVKPKLFESYDIALKNVGSL
jgi:glycosyltransferase involved in cell wall biosynthesis